MGNKDNPHVDANHDEHVNNRRERLEQRAESARDRSDTHYAKAKTKAQAIPFGQPILVGHHSEHRDRNYRSTITRNFEKSFEESNTADKLDQRAESVGQGGISSSDPTAVGQLTDKLIRLKQNQAFMKQANRQFKTGGWGAVTGITDEQRQTLKTQTGPKDRPFPAYKLSNNNARIRHVKRRITEIQTLRSTGGVNHRSDGYSLSTEKGRISVVFDNGKPSEKVRKLLKSYSFKWSRNRLAWVRKSTANAQYAAQRLITVFDEMASLY